MCFSKPFWLMYSHILIWHENSLMIPLGMVCTNCGASCVKSFVSWSFMVLVTDILGPLPHFSLPREQFTDWHSLPRSISQCFCWYQLYWLKMMFPCYFMMCLSFRILIFSWMFASWFSSGYFDWLWSLYYGVTCLFESLNHMGFVFTQS